MKTFRLLGVSAAVIVLFNSCESTDTAGRGNQEAKRQAALEQARQQGQPDEAQRNLWNTQNDRLNRDGNAARQF